jgi:hypothetical protein
MSFGNQAGAGGSPAVAPGVITGTGRTIQADDGAEGFSETLHGMFATTARIEPGDSGGPLVGPAGTVIGVDTAAGAGGADTGYAIPIDAAMAAERQITGRGQGQGISLGVDGFLGVIVGSGAARSPLCRRPKNVASERVRLTLPAHPDASPLGRTPRRPRRSPRHPPARSWSACCAEPAPRRPGSPPVT